MTKSTNIPVKYVPKSLKRKDFLKQKQIIKTRKLYKKGKYITRKKVSSYKSKPSKHLLNVKKIYKINKLRLNKELQKKTKCNLKSLEKIIKKVKEHIIILLVQDQIKLLIHGVLLD